MSAFNIWAESKPPKLTFVWAKYKLVDDPCGWQLVKTCRRGCCVYSQFGCMLLPKYWKEATEAEGAAEQAKWDAPQPSIDLWEIYAR